MLYLLTLAEWLLTAAIAIPLGIAILPLLNEREPNSIPLAFMAGLSGVSLLAMPASLFMACNGYMLMLFGVFAAGCSFRYKSALMHLFKREISLFSHFPVSLKLLLLLFIPVLLFYSNLGALIHDNGLYYLPYIKWLNTYEVVPGLGNVHGRFGFNSSWHLLSALFNLRFITGNGLNQLNGLLFFMAVWYASALDYTNLNGLSRNNLVRAGGVFIGFLLYKTLGCPSADMPVAVLTYIIVLLYLEEDGNEGLLCLLTFWLLTIKLSSFPVALPAIFGLIRLGSTKNYKLTGITLILALLVFVPWLYRNYLLSGYLIYPVYSINLFNPDWKVPLEIAFDESRAVTAWARMPLHPTLEAVDYPLMRWLPEWKSNLRGTNTLISVMVFISVLGGVLFTLLKAVKRAPLKLDLFGRIWLMLLAAIGFWFYKMPNFRFGYGVLLCFCMLNISFLYLQFPALTRFVKVPFIIGAGLLLMLAQIPEALKISKQMKPHTEFAEYRLCGNLFINVPVAGDQCENMPLPCAALPDSTLELRGSDLRQGFRHAGKPCKPAY